MNVKDVEVLLSNQAVMHYRSLAECDSGCAVGQATHPIEPLLS
jgi:hypothetical protein